MIGKNWPADLEHVDLDGIVADLETIRRYNRQRFEMEQLTAVCYEDHINRVCVGYKQVGLDEFWVRGHMPGAALMPGVLMCEAAAQLCSYLACRTGVLADFLIGLGGLDEVRFRGVVRPGDRLNLVVRLLRVRPRVLMVWQFQGFVERQLVCEGLIRGVALPLGEAT